MAEMEDVHGILDEHGEGAGEAPSTAGPSNLDESSPEQTPGGVGGATTGVAYSAYSSARLLVPIDPPRTHLAFRRFHALPLMSSSVFIVRLQCLRF